MSTATSGKQREYKVKYLFAEHGWVPIIRAAGSKGPADLLMAHEVHGAALIQVGTVSKTLGPADRARFTQAAHLCGALCLLATVSRGVVTVHEVTLDVPSKWVDVTADYLN